MISGCKKQEDFVWVYNTFSKEISDFHSAKETLTFKRTKKTLLKQIADNEEFDSILREIEDEEENEQQQQYT